MTIVVVVVAAVTTLPSSRSLIECSKIGKGGTLLLYAAPHNTGIGCTNSKKSEAATAAALSSTLYDSIPTAYFLKTQPFGGCVRLSDGIRRFEVTVGQDTK